MESDWKLEKALFLAVALLGKIPGEHYEENQGEIKTTNLGHAYKRILEGESYRRNRRTYPELDLAGSETVVGPLLLTADTGGGEIGVAGKAGVVGVTGVTGVAGMLESLRLIWLCSEGPLLSTFIELSLLLDFYKQKRKRNSQADLTKAPYGKAQPLWFQMH